VTTDDLVFFCWALPLFAVGVVLIVSSRASTLHVQLWKTLDSLINFGNLLTNITVRLLWAQCVHFDDGPSVRADSSRNAELQKSFLGSSLVAATEVFPGVA